MRGGVTTSRGYALGEATHWARRRTGDGPLPTLLAMASPIPDKPLSAIPSVGARIAAFVSVCLSGLAGALIGYSLIEIQCEGDCGLAKGIGLFVGAVIAAAGMAVVAVLVMRALGEWREANDREGAGHAF